MEILIASAGRRYLFSLLAFGAFATVWTPSDLLSTADAAFQEGRIALASDRDGDFEILTMSPDGSDVKQLTNNSFSDTDPAWSPDGRQIVFSSLRDDQTDLYLIDTATGSESRLTNDAARDFEPSFSPDGKRLVFQSREGTTDKIIVMNIDGSNRVQVASDQPQPGVDPGHPMFTPAGTQIVYSLGVDAAKNEETSNEDIYVVNSDGNDRKQLTTDKNFDNSPVLARSGNKIFFLSDRASSLSNDIWTMGIDGSAEIKVTSVGGISDAPALSPGATQLIYTKSGLIYKVNADGSQTSELPSSGYNSSPSWSAPFSASAVPLPANPGSSSLAVSLTRPQLNASKSKRFHPRKFRKLLSLGVTAKVSGATGAESVGMAVLRKVKSGKCVSLLAPTKKIACNQTGAEGFSVELAPDATSSQLKYQPSTKSAKKGTYIVVVKIFTDPSSASARTFKFTCEVI